MQQSQTIMETFAGLSTRVKALLFAVVLLMSVATVNLASITLSKVHADPADYMTYSWTEIFPDDPDETGTMKVLGCKVYREDPYYGPLYDISLWVVNDTNHHRTFQWQQYRAVPPNSMEYIRSGDLETTWDSGVQMAQEFSVSAWYDDLVLPRFIDTSMPLRSGNYPAAWMANCY